MTVMLFIMVIVAKEPSLPQTGISIYKPGPGTATRNETVRTATVKRHFLGKTRSSSLRCDCGEVA